MDTSVDNPLPAPPTEREVWWVAVEDAIDRTGGWIVLADEGERGAKQIEQALSQASVAFMAAIDASQLKQALEGTNPSTVVAWRAHDGQTSGERYQQSEGEVLFHLRLNDPTDTVLLVENLKEVHALQARLDHLVKTSNFDGIRMDLRDRPRGQGAWGLALARSS